MNITTIVLPLADLKIVQYSTAILASAIVTLIILLVIFRKKQRRFREDMEKIISGMLDEADSLVIVWSQDGRQFKANDVFCQTSGYTPEELVGRSDVLKSIVGYKSDSLQEFVTVAENGTALEMTSANGSTVDILWKSSFVSLENGKGFYITTGVDRTRLLTLEREILKLENHFEMVAELSEIGFMLRKAGSESYVLSPQLVKMLGAKTQVLSVEEFAQRVYPEDKTLYEAYYKRINLESESGEPCPMRQLDMRIKSDDGGYHWYHMRYKLIELDGVLYMGATLVDVSEEKEKDTLIEKMAYIDNVTQIYNRNKFLLMGEETFVCAREVGTSYWLMILDVDKFHIINDTCGYQNGNRLLKDIAILLIRCIDDSAFCARIGGDNFAVLVKDTGDDGYIKEIFYSLSDGLKELSRNRYLNQTITASAGYCRIPDDGKNFAECFERAEFALRLGTQARSNLVQYQADTHDAIIFGNVIEREMEQALKNNEFCLYYQPKINLETQKIIGIEALIRWIKPNGEVIMPNVFIPVAENSMFITKISRFVIDEACRQNKIWHDMGHKELTVSVNLSSTDFYQTDVCSLIKRALDDSGLEPKFLEIELTETLALKDVEKAISQMLTLKDEIGVKISMDDFGTGYSSLSYIQVLPISLLKLDRSFIMHLEDDKVSRQIVTSVINIAKSKQIETVAEGIETELQADILKATGCDHAQGYYFGKPMPSDKMAEFLDKWVAV